MEIPGENHRWYVTLPLGDFDDDGMMDLLLTGDSYSRSGLGWAPGWSARWLDGDVPSPTTLHFAGGAQPLATILRRPTGVSLLAEDARTTPYFQHRFFDLAGGQLLGTVPYPPAPSQGLPEIGFLGTIHRAGDVNCDGYEDAFFQTYTGSWGVTGVVDGQSMTVLWQHYLPDSGGGGRAVHCRTASGWPDIDGDGSPDLVYGTIRSYGPQAFERTVEAISGATGAVLWSQNYPEGDAAGAVVDDLNGDGIAEVLFAAPGFGALQCLDGATGAELWSAPVSGSVSLLPATLPLHFYTHAIGMSRSAETGAREVVIQTYCLDSLSGQDESGFLQLDAMTGAPLRYRTVEAQDLRPWLPDSAVVERDAVQVLGDFDRDGVVEVTARNWTPSLTNPQASGDAFSMVVWAPCTLEAPATASPGSTAVFQTRIPSSPGRFAFLAMSRGFDAEQGMVHLDWPLHLADDGLFRITTSLAGGAPPLWMILDSTGFGAVSLAVPTAPALLGTVVYSKVVVPELPQPNGIYTASTLGVTTITP